MNLRKLSLTAVAALTAGTLLISVPALAGGPLAVFQSGQPFLYPNGGANIPFNPDQGGFGPWDNAMSVQVIEDAFMQWENVPSASNSYVNAGPLPVDVDTTNFFPYVFPASPDGLSAVVLDEDGSLFDLLFGFGTGVLGFAGPEWVNIVTGDILESVCFMNGRFLANGQVQFDSQFGVFVHEFGHYTNLAHTVTNGEIAAFLDENGPTPNNTFGNLNPFQLVETMYPFALILPDGSDFGGTASPAPDDIAILSTLYPEPGFFSDNGSISGTIYAPDETTKLTGVNVIARNVADPLADAVSAISSDFTDSTSQADPVVGTYTINGLTPGATYAVYVDEILAGGFSTAILSPLPGPEEFYNGVDESSDGSTDDASVYTGIVAAAGVNETADIIFNRPGPGDPLAVGDDGFVELFMPFTFSFCGTDYNSLFVNANGSVSFGAPSSDFSESPADMLGGPPRIAGLWDDLNPSQGGIVTYGETNNEFTVSWTDVPEFFATGANTFSITLQRSSNQIDLDWGVLSAEDGLAGISCGGAVTIGNEPSMDLTALAQNGTINGRISPAVYESWPFGTPNDVAGESITITAPKEFVDKNEFNDTIAAATKVSLPFSSGDQIGDSPKFTYTDISPVGGDIDFYELTLEADKTLLAEVTFGNLDSLMGLFDAGGNLVAVDDDGGAGLLSQITYAVPTSGTYYLAVTTFADFGFTGAGGSGGRYVVDVETFDGILLSLGDDSSTEVPFQNFDFPFQGAMWSSVWVNSNGNLTFGAGDTDFTESVSEFLNESPRIAPLWDDLSPNNGGRVIVSRTATSMTVSFEDVPEFLATGANTFAVTMDASGGVDITYGATNGNDGLVGITEGGGAADPGETDLSAAGGLSATGTTYELFFSGEFDLDFTSLVFTP